MNQFCQQQELSPKLFLLTPFFLMALLLLFFFWPQAVGAADLGGQIEKLEVEIEINTDGSAQVEQKISFLTSSNFLYWIIPQSKVENIEIKEQSRIIFPTDIKKRSDQTVVFWRSSSNSPDYYQTATLSYLLPSQVAIRYQRQLIQTVIFREPGIFIKEAEVTISYPKQIVGEVKQRFFAIHGVEEAELISAQNHSFRYRLANLSSYAIFSTNLSFPANSLSISLIDRLKIFLGSLSLETVVLISLFIPLLIYLYLFFLYRNHVYTKDVRKVKGSLSQLPDKLPLPLVEMLMKNRLTTKSIGALILQLLTKNYLTIIDREDKIFIGKIKEPDQELSELEKMVIKILFRQKELRGGLAEIKRKKSQRLFDQLTDRFYQRVDYLINRERFFIGDTTRIKESILRQGIIIFFLAVLLAIFFLFFIPSSPWLALAPVSLIVASLMIIRMRSVFTIRSPRGQNQLLQWLKFKNYLAQPHPTRGADQKTFEEYLPWAYLFESTNSWVRKFSRYPLARPKWFVSSHYGLTTEDWVKKTTDLIDELTKEIAGLKSPTS